MSSPDRINNEEKSDEVLSYGQFSALLPEGQKDILLVSIAKDGQGDVPVGIVFAV